MGSQRWSGSWTDRSLRLTKLVVLSVMLTAMQLRPPVTRRILSSCSRESSVSHCRHYGSSKACLNWKCTTGSARTQSKILTQIPDRPYSGLFKTPPSRCVGCESVAVQQASCAGVLVWREPVALWRFGVAAALRALSRIIAILVPRVIRSRFSCIRSSFACPALVSSSNIGFSDRRRSSTAPATPQQSEHSLAAHRPLVVPIDARGLDSYQP